MTDKEKLEKIKRLADAMYNKMAYLTSDTRPIRQAMEDYHNFIVHEYNKDEQVDKPIDFEQELYNYFGQVKDFTLGMRIAKRFYDMGRKYHEPVSEDLEEVARNYGDELDSVLCACEDDDSSTGDYATEAFKAGAQWQKAKDEYITDDLGEYINELSKQFPEVSFAKLSRIAVRVAKWQKENMIKND